MERLKNMYKGSAARETLDETNSRRVIQVTRDGAMSARNHGVLRLRSTETIAPSRVSVGRSLVMSSSRSKGFISTARLPTKTSKTTPSTATQTLASPTRAIKTLATPSRAIKTLATPTRAIKTLATPTRATQTPVTPSHASTARRSMLLASPSVKSSAFTPRHTKSIVASGSRSSAEACAFIKPLNTVPLQSHRNDSGVGLATSGVTKPDKKDLTTGHSVPFSITGPYVRVAVVSGSAALWAANGETGTIDVFSIVSGKMLTQISARVTASGVVAKPLALMATKHHVWVGFDDGMVIIYDHLCITQLTMGLFHTSPIVAFCVMANGITISGSVDMALVRWDKEDKNFEAIARIVGVSETHQALTCMAALAADIVLCGSMSGNIVAVDCASGVQVTTLRGHTGRVNALVVIGDLIFSAAEDGFVNVWILKVSGASSDITLQRTCRLLNRIFVQVAVRDLVPYDSAHSLLVAYVDGLVERWSASPDDEFAVEQVLRKAFIDSKESEQRDNQRQELLSLSSIGSVETMRVLALGSGGVSKVWCGHRNVLEDQLTESINSINAVISQESEEAFAWEQKALKLKQKEKERKKQYSLLLFRFNKRWLLSRYYKKWQSQSNFFNSQTKQNENISLTMMDNKKLCLLRRYFSKWYHLYDFEQRRSMRLLLATRLERLSKHVFIAQMISRWRKTITFRKALRQKEEIAKMLLNMSNGILLKKFFVYWQFCSGVRSGKLSAEKLSLLVRKSRQSFLRRVYQSWMSAYKQRKMSKEKNRQNISLNTANTLATRPTCQMALFAKAYAKVTEERWRRRIFFAWRRWQEHRRNISSLRLFAIAAERRCQRNTMYRAWVNWRLFCQKKSLDKRMLEVQEVERCLRQAEETNVDIVDKLQLQKRLDHLRRQHDEEQRQLQEKNGQIQKLMSDLEALRQSLGYSCGLRCGANDEKIESTSNIFFSPSILQQMPVTEAMSLVMMRLKGTVVNIYTDMSLFRQIKDRIRCGTTAVILFLEGFQEVKRTIVNLLKKTTANALRSGARWPLTVDMLEDLPLHVCNTIVHSIKAMAISYDMVNVCETETLASTRTEILANTDLIFSLWRIAYTARKPTLPENKRVASRQ